MNAITKRIQEAVRDTARLENLELTANTIAPKKYENEERQDFLDTQKELTEDMLDVLSESSSPVLKNMKMRIQATLGNIEVLRKKN